MREIHVAGAMVSLVQRCQRCGELLSDYRNAMIPAGDPMPSGWAVGAHIEIERGHPFVTQKYTTEETATCEEQPA